MKKLFLVLTALVFPLTVAAQVLAQENDQLEIAAAENYRWLYEEVIPLSDRQNFPAESFKSFRVHLKDTYQNFPKPSEIQSANLVFPPKIHGRMTYVGFVKKHYRQDILRKADGGFVIRVRVYLKQASESDIQHFSAKLKEAEEIWNAHRIATDFDYSFQFEIVRDRRLADFSVFILDDTRGPYDSIWGRDWSGRTIAHEVGHMLGLGDEYETLTSKSDCLKSSLMCESSRGELQPFHYYFILRRLILPST